LSHLLPRINSCAQGDGGRQVGSTAAFVWTAHEETRGGDVASEAGIGEQSACSGASVGDRGSSGDEGHDNVSAGGSQHERRA
jgi:hypothetical protein